MIDVKFGVAEGVATATDLSGENATIVLNARRKATNITNGDFRGIIELHYFLLSQLLDQAFKAFIVSNLIKLDVGILDSPVYFNKNFKFQCLAWPLLKSNYSH